LSTLNDAPSAAAAEVSAAAALAAGVLGASAAALLGVPTGSSGTISSATMLMI
jgi:hypothetical protein